VDRKDLLHEQFALTQEVEDGAVRVRVFDELDIATVPLLESEIEQATQDATVLELGDRS
jgi:hypothetical protein